MKDVKMVYGINSGFIDFYGKFSITIFLCGCNLHCSYCYNMDIVQGKPKMTFQEVMKNLSDLQKSFLSGKLRVVLSGGEPTVSEYFDIIVNELKDKYILGIHTNGLVVPEFDNIFDAVVLSLKSPDDGLNITCMDDYIEMIFKSINYYDSCQIKQIRIVRISEQKEWMDEILSNLKDKTKSWNIKYVTKIDREERIAI